MRCEHERAGIKYLVDQIRSFNEGIGHYQVHALDPNDFNFSIKLSNGIIRISWEELQERYSLDEERKKSIAGRFQQRD